MNQSLLFTPSVNPISPVLEMGAYEALWDEPGASFKKIAERFRDAPGSMPSDFVDQARAKHYAELTLDITKACDISCPGIRLHGAAEYPQKLRDAKHPIALIYFRGHWELTETRSVAVLVFVVAKHIAFTLECHNDSRQGIVKTSCVDTLKQSAQEFVGLLRGRWHRCPLACDHRLQFTANGKVYLE